MPLTPQQKGIALATIGGLTISLDIPVIRLALSDPYAAVTVRGFAMAIIFLLIWLFAKEFTDTPKRPLADADFLTVGATYGIMNIMFTTAVFRTSAANLVFIMAFNPMIVALLAWWMIGKRPSRATWLMIITTVIGVSLIVGGSLQAGNAYGDVLALGVAFTLAYALVRTSKSGKDLSLAPGFGGVISGCYGLVFCFVYSHWPGAPWWLIVNAAIIMPIAMFTLSLAPRFISAPHTAMFYLLETVLTPIWIWLIFADIPGAMTLVGGAIVLIAIMAHSWWQLRPRT